MAPGAYDGLRVYPVSNNPVTKETYHFYLDGGHGGWGGLTMGLLTPLSLAEKSFFSIPRMTPSLVLMPMEVEPNYDKCLTKKGVTYFDRLDSILNLVDSALGVESVNTL